jgi:hypothetical protein
VQVYDWAEGERRVQRESVTAFLLEQFVRYLELMNLSPFSGMRASDFDFFVTPTEDGQVEVKGRLESLWQAVAEALPDTERAVLGEFHVGALGLTDPNAWAMTNRGEEKINLTLEMTRQELWFNIVGWQVPRAQDLLEWLQRPAAGDELQRLPGYDLVAFRRRCGNWAKRAPGKRAWWQRETFKEVRRYPAPEVGDHFDRFWRGSPR